MLQFIRARPLATFYFVVYLVPALSFAALVVPKLLAGQPMRNTDALIMFPIMELGVFLAAIVLTAIVEERGGVARLFGKMGRGRTGLGWYVFALLVPPAGILAVLAMLSRFVSSDYRPNTFVIGVLFGLLAGFLEETRWTGFVLPRLLRKRSALASALIIGALWVLWHLPVVNFLGIAGPHGAYWLRFYLAFALVLLTMRVLMVWLYRNTRSLLLCQLMHAALTGSLVALGAPHVSAGEEAAWYAAFGVLLAVVALVIVALFGARLTVNASLRSAYPDD